MSLVIMKSTLTHLQKIYLWPKTTNSTTIPSYLTLLSGSFLLFGSLLNLIMTTINNQDNDIVANILTVSSQFGVMYFASFFIINRKSTTRIIKNLSDFYQFGKPPHFDRRNKELDNLAKLFRIGLYVAIVLVFLWPAIYTKECKEDICRLVAPVWLPFNYSKFPLKQIIYLWQCYCCLVTYGAAGMISMMMLETMEHLIIKIQHLKILLEDMIEETNFTLKYELLQICIDYHNFIFSIREDMNRSFKVSLSVHVLVAGVLFGFIGHTIMENAFTIDSISLFSGWFGSLFVVCVGGQHLIDESESVSFTIYNTRWYLLDVKFQKNILPIIIRSQRPILIHAGPFTFLSLLLILTVLQTSYSYINLLNATS